MVSDVTHPPPPNSPFFSLGFRRFTKMTFVKSGGTVSPVAPPLYRTVLTYSTFNSIFLRTITCLLDSRSNRDKVLPLSRDHCKRCYFSLALCQSFPFQNKKLIRILSWFNSSELIRLGCREIWKMDQNEVTKHFSVGNSFLQATMHARIFWIYCAMT